MRLPAPEDHGLGPIAAIHSAEYLTFLRTIHARWSRIEGAAPEVIPNIHPDRRAASYPQSAIGQAGFHQADTACPIGAQTWESAYWSAQTALTGADLVLGGERARLCAVPPAGPPRLRRPRRRLLLPLQRRHRRGAAARGGRRPAILDVDVHHGNGTQGVFYERGDVLTVSIHADPARFYPFFWGHAHERGEGAGRGANLNLPLPRGTGDDDYLKTLATALDRIDAFGADAWWSRSASTRMRPIRSRVWRSRRTASPESARPSAPSACRRCWCRRAAICRMRWATISPAS
jgi:acetoin utilization deacetylase AcuC-like enzyme